VEIDPFVKVRQRCMHGFVLLIHLDALGLASHAQAPQAPLSRSATGVEIDGRAAAARPIRVDDVLVLCDERVDERQGRLLAA
jgi:hypothetical protein